MKLSSSFVYGVGFLLLAVFCCWTYGDVFHHIALDNFVCSDAEAMTFVRRSAYGSIFWAARYLLLVFNNQWVGGIVMAAFLTLTAWLFDRLALSLSSGKPGVARHLCGVGFLPVLALLSWMVYRGYNLYFRCDISTFVVWTVLLFLVALVAGLVALVMRRKVEKGISRFAAAPLVVLLAYAGLTWQAFVPGENVRATCRMQNILDETQDWQAMAETGRSCVRPSRSVAAYYIIALVQQNQLLEHAFDIPFDYPKLKLDDIGGDDEGINYIADCNLYAGLPNSAYHTSMENHVMTGPRLRTYKRMAICSILSGENKLASRYLHIINTVPFQKGWVKEYLEYLDHPEMIVKNPVFSNILSMYPREQRFEQNYRQPVFLGYNAGLLSGSDNTLVTSVATCMYSKDLNNLLLRTNFLQQKISLPLTVQQSIYIASLNREGLLDQYPQVKGNAMLQAEFRNFLAEAQPFLARKKELQDEEAKKALQHEMSEALRENWLGTYYYYYYCGNIEQTVKKTESHGVN